MLLLVLDVKPEPRVLTVCALDMDSALDSESLVAKDVLI